LLRREEDLSDVDTRFSIGPAFGSEVTVADFRIYVPD